MLDRPERVPGLFGIWRSPVKVADNGMPKQFTGVSAVEDCPAKSGMQM